MAVCGSSSIAGLRRWAGASVCYKETLVMRVYLWWFLALVSDCLCMPNCCFVSRARFLVVAGCLGPCSCAPILVLLVHARGPALRLGVFLLGFPAVVCIVTKLSLIHISEPTRPY